MCALTNPAIAGAHGQLAAGEISALDLTEAHIAAVEAARSLTDVITEAPEQALEMAEASDARRKAGQAGLLEGIPIGMKDLFCTEGVLTTAGSHLLDGFHPTYESTVSRNLWDAGAVLLGKTNLDAFAMGDRKSTRLNSSH